MGRGVENLSPVSVDAVLSQAADPVGSMADSLVRGGEASGLIDFVSGDMLSGAEAQAAFAELGSDALYEYCFAAGTLLLMADGTAKPIEQIRPGQEVLPVPDREVVATLGRRELVASVPGSTWKQPGREAMQFCPVPEPRPVVDVYHNAPARLLNLYIGDEVIRSTFGHPFFVRGCGWIQAEDLAIGDELRMHTGDWVAITDVVDSGRIEPVYNLQVDENHTYFVVLPSSDASVLVHNQSLGNLEEFDLTGLDPVSILREQGVPPEELVIYAALLGDWSSVFAIDTISQSDDGLAPAADPRWESVPVRGMLEPSLSGYETKEVARTYQVHSVFDYYDLARIQGFSPSIGTYSLVEVLRSIFPPSDADTVVVYEDGHRLVITPHRKVCVLWVFWMICGPSRFLDHDATVRTFSSCVADTSQSALRHLHRIC